MINRNQNLWVLFISCIFLCYGIPGTHAQPARENEYIVVAQLNLWYFGEGCYGGFEDYDCEGNPVVSITPLQGLYHSSDPQVIKNQINWAVEYGVDAFSIEWISPRYRPGSLEENMDDHLLVAPDIHKIRWCIFYDFNLRLGWSGISIRDGINFDNAAVADTFIYDFVHFGRKYFHHPQYLYVDGRPIIYIWNTGGFIGDFESVLKKAKDSLSTMGFDVFVSGDEINNDVFDTAHVALFDAVTTFTMLIGGTGPFENMDSAAVGVDKVFNSWQSQLQGLKVKDRKENVILQPAWAPQYKDSLFRFHNDMGEGQYVPAESKEQVIHMAEVARSYANPPGREAEKIIWLNTYNNWAETTTIEPTIAAGPKYPAGNYQFDMLEVVKEVFGGETYWDPAISVGEYRPANLSIVRLEQNYPNPVNNSTRIDFTLKKHTLIELAVYNVLGCKVSELIYQEMDPGSYSTLLEVGNLANGPYICVLKAGQFIEIVKFVVLK
jgi:hypothetical protein